MDDQTIQPGGPERRLPMADEPVDPADSGHLNDPRALTILTTEHLSLLTARSLVYNEAFSRAGMFLTFLTGTLVALGFVSQGSGYGPEFLLVATALLGFDLMIGLATLGRIQSAGVEEFRTLQGMNRLRHAYLEMVPSLEPYFVMSRHDDLLSVLAIYGVTTEEPADEKAAILGDIVHGLTTTPGMIGAITAAVGGAFAAALVLLLGASPMFGVVVGLTAFVVLTIGFGAAFLRQFQVLERQFVARFPASPPDGKP